MGRQFDIVLAKEDVSSLSSALSRFSCVYWARRSPKNGYSPSPTLEKSVESNAAMIYAAFQYYSPNSGDDKIKTNPFFHGRDPFVEIMLIKKDDGIRTGRIYYQKIPDNESFNRDADSIFSQIKKHLIVSKYNFLKNPAGDGHHVIRTPDGAYVEYLGRHARAKLNLE